MIPSKIKLGFATERYEGTLVETEQMKPERQVGSSIVFQGAGYNVAAVLFSLIHVVD